MFRWLKNPKVFSLLLALLLVGLLIILWLALGFSRSFLLWTVFSLLLLVVVVLVVDRILARRSGGLLETMFRNDADGDVMNAKPEERAEVSHLRHNLLLAIDTIKKSKLGRTRGSAALYELPWYMLLGHSSAGKSSAIENSGLVFPLKGKDGIAVKGVGGTRDCDWFFSTEGILLDTAGRYSDQPQDRAEWLGFLKLLKKHRAKAPLNGILVALSLPELQKPNSDFFASYARQLRQRVNEVDEAFGMKVPLYLMITKMDLLGGFASFFEDFTEEERRKVWGATLTHEQAKDFDAAQVIGQHFDALHEGIVQRGLEKLSLTRNQEKHHSLFTFPMEFHALKEPLSRFIALLMEEDPYHSRPFIRSVCFSSSLQREMPESACGQRLSSLFGLPDFPPVETTAPSRSYFLETLFKQVIFPDQFLVGLARSRHDRIRIAGLAAGLLLLGLLSGTWAFSFVTNQKLIREAHEQHQEFLTTMNQGHLPEKLAALQLLQVRIEQLGEWHKKGHPWSYGWGLYQGKPLEDTLRKEYFRELQALFLTPVKGSLEAYLRKFVKGDAAPATPAQGKTLENTQETAYNALKTYLMLQDRQRMDATHLTDQLSRYWRPWLEESIGVKSLDETTHRIAERTVAFFVSQIEALDLPVIQSAPEVVEQSRARIHGEIRFLNPHQRVYNQIKAVANAKFPQLTVGSILNKVDQDIIGGSSAVPGAFTRDAWNGYVQTTIQEASQGRFKGSDWVLNSEMDNDLTRHGSIEQNVLNLTTLYKADYIKEWERFISGIALLGFESPAKSAVVLGRLASLQASPIKLVLQRAALETSWDNPTEIAKTTDSLKKSVLDKATSLLGTTPAPVAAAAPPARGEVGNHFAVLNSLVTGDKPPIDNYLEMLQKVRNKLNSVGSAPEAGQAARQLMQATLGGSGSELSEASNYVDGMLLAQASESEKQTLRALLLRPLMQSSGSLTSLTEQDLNQLWAQVYHQWEPLSKKYPFSDSTNDAPMADIMRFLKPGDGVLARFVDNCLSGFVVRHGATLVPRTFGGVSLNFHPAFLTSIARLQKAANTLQGGDVCSFELKPQPISGIVETVLDIDGEKLIYRNGPQFWKQINWSGAKADSGIQLRVVSDSGASAQLIACQGRLDIMRWLDSAKIENPEAASTLLTWPIAQSKPLACRSGKNPGPVCFEFRTVSGINLLSLKALRNHILPSRITR